MDKGVPIGIVADKITRKHQIQYIIRRNSNFYLKNPKLFKNVYLEWWSLMQEEEV